MRLAQRHAKRPWHQGLVCVLLLSVSSLVQAAGVAISVAADHPDAPVQLRTLPDKALARIAGIPLDRPDGPTVDIEVQRFSIFAPDAKVIIRDEQGDHEQAPPAAAHYKGEILGHPGSVAFWSVAADGSMWGIVHLDGNVYLTDTPIAARGEAARTQLRKVNASLEPQAGEFACGVKDEPELRVRGQKELPQTVSSAALAATRYTVRVAVDTDYEFLQQFADSAQATEYVANQLAYVSTIYADELEARLQVSALYLYANPDDPWNADSSSDALSELSAYWRANRSSVNRSLVHKLTAKPNHNMAYPIGLCHNERGYSISTARYRAPYPPSLSIADGFLIAHEIGHVFGSPHTHCYAGIEGNASAVDGCDNTGGSRCYSGTTALPGIGSLSGGVPGTGTGTIMSYCHQLTGGWSNVSMTFGLDHIYGVAANRVPKNMRTALEAAAATFPGCFTTNNDSLTVGKAGLGTITSWPPGIDCGADCSEFYPLGTSVELIATPAGGSVFSGWSRACSGKGTCTISLAAAKSVTATFTPVVDAGSANANQWVQRAYVAYYGRPADPDGLAYWSWRMDWEGGSLSSIITAFGTSDEFTRRYGGLTFSQLIDTLYQQTLGRAPDAAGKDWYMSQLAAGRTTLQTITLDLLGGATGSDALTVANRLDVANHYTGKVAAGCPYGGELTGVSSLGAVTFDSATTWAAKLAIEGRCGP